MTPASILQFEKVVTGDPLQHGRLRDISSEMSFNMIETAFDWCSTYLAGERIQVLFQDAPGRCSTEDLEASGRGSMTADADISSISTECSGSVHHAPAHIYNVDICRPSTEST